MVACLSVLNGRPQVTDTNSQRQSVQWVIGRRCERTHHIADTLRCEHQQSQPEQTGFKFVIKGPQERMPRVFDNELETSQRCFLARKLGRTQIKKCKLCYETVPCCAAGYDGRAAARPYRLK
jgi:hypothetical protein